MTRSLARWLAPALVAVAAPSLAQNGMPVFGRVLTIQSGLQGRVMWVDGTANLVRTATPEGIRDIVARCKAANISTLVVDVKPVSGQVLYASKVAERMRRWNGRDVPDLDILAEFVQAGHAAGIEVAASVNMLSEGHKQFGAGMAFGRPDLQSVAYVVDRALVTANGNRLPVRGQGDPEDRKRPLARDDTYAAPPTGEAAGTLVVTMSPTGEVEAMADVAMWGDEPIAAPERGRLLALTGEQTDWAAANIQPGVSARFDARGKRVPSAEEPAEKVAVFVSPYQAEARKRALDIVREIASNYAVDAIVFDRLRYANLYNDTSDAARRAFEQWIGKRVANFPEDIISFDPVPGEPPRRGPLFRPWLEFRARTIRDLISEAAAAARAARPGIQVAAYVGSWFTEYYGVGVNWGSEKLPVRTSWATPDYNEAGYAEQLDWLTTGCYYGYPTRDEARAAGASPGGSVEAAADVSTRAVSASVPVYAGLYAVNYKDRPKAFEDAISAACRFSNGVMIFDISYIYDYGWWDSLQRAMGQPALPPHRVPGLFLQMRAARDAAFDNSEAARSAGTLSTVPWQAGGG